MNILGNLVSQIMASNAAKNVEKKVDRRGQKAFDSVAELREKIEKNLPTLKNVTVSDIATKFSAEPGEARRTLLYFEKKGRLMRVGLRDNPIGVKKKREILWSSR